MTVAVKADQQVAAPWPLGGVTVAHGLILHSLSLVSSKSTLVHTSSSGRTS